MLRSRTRTASRLIPALLAAALVLPGGGSPGGAADLKHGIPELNRRARLGAQYQRARQARIHYTAFSGGYRRERLVALTFDDGPHPVYTQVVLNILKRERVPATFFVVGRNAERWQLLVQRAAAEGHDLGNHTYRHLSLPTLQRDEMVYEIERANDAIEHVVGIRPRWFRAPGCYYSPESLRLLRELGMVRVDTTLNSGDHTGLSVRQIIARTLSQLDRGDVILCHDRLSSTVGALPLLIREVRRRGYRFVSLAELALRAQADRRFSPPLWPASKDLRCAESTGPRPCLAAGPAAPKPGPAAPEPGHAEQGPPEKPPLEAAAGSGDGPRAVQHAGSRAAPREAPALVAAAVTLPGGIAPRAAAELKSKLSELMAKLPELNRRSRLAAQNQRARQARIHYAAFSGGYRRERLVALTFDDGPHPVYTQAVLNILKRERVPATFFMVGRNAERWQLLVQRAAAEGHDLGNHTYRHLSLPTLQRDEMVYEIERANDAIEHVVGIRPRWFRAPGCYYSPESLRLLRELGMVRVDTTLNSGDHTGLSVKEIVARTLSQLDRGDVILCHDRLSSTVRALPLLIREVRRRGYEFVPLAELALRAQADRRFSPPLWPANEGIRCTHPARPRPRLAVDRAVPEPKPVEKRPLEGGG